MAVITSADPDHLDIYGTPEAYRESFEHFTSLIRPDGFLIMKKGIHVTPRLQTGVRFFTYAGARNLDSDMKTCDVDFYAENVRIGNGEIVFDFIGPDVRIDNIQLGVPVKVNIENGVAAIAVAWLNGVTAEEIRKGMASFAGPCRRFDFHLKKDNIVLIDDYAHHPAELEASILSVKELYAGRKVTGIFQPHLYSRTRDFASDFAASLSLLDELILLDIYPAREEPIPGITSKIIFDVVTIPNKRMVQRDDLLDLVIKEQNQFDVVLMVGAGNIELLVEPVKQILDKKV
jgi:UDP-N-acetylmuramate--alanine ligase